MTTALLIPILLLAIPIVAILGGILVAVIKLLKGGDTGGGGALSAEEARLMQELHQGLETMESRIEALETILLERADAPARSAPKTNGAAPSAQER